MSQSDGKKTDLSNIPRGAIGIKGLPVNRNARLPSIRTPRDLTLGAQTKRTFMPNIPVRREKKAESSSNQPNQEKKHVDKKVGTHKSDRGRGRGKARGQIIQTAGSVFGEGIAVTSPSPKTRPKESHSASSERFIVKREAKDVVCDLNVDLSNLLRDDFIDDGSDSESGEEFRPVIYPVQELKQESKKEEISESTDFQSNDVAKEMGYNIDKIAKFIKKEKVDEAPRQIQQKDLSGVLENETTNLLTSTDSDMFLIRLPVCITAQQPQDDLQKKTASSESEQQNEEPPEANLSLSSLAEGRIGRLQVLRSGRARLVLGELHLDLDCVSPLRTRHEVAVSRQNDLSVLGTVRHKLNFAPDMHRILDAVLK